MKENNIVTYLGLMEDDLWDNHDVTEASFDIAISVICNVRRRLLEGTLVEVTKDSSSDNWWCVTAESIKKAEPTKNQRIANSMKTMTWKTIK